MSRTKTPRFEDLPRSLLGRVDDLCCEFESAWKSGERPRLEVYLSRVDDVERGPLLDAALRVEAEYRLSLGERFLEEEYLARFPEHAAVVRAVFAPAETPVPEQSIARTDAYQPAVSDEDDLDRAPPPLPRYTEFGVPSLGGMGAVWRCRDARLRQWVAVKVLQERLRSSPELLRRFQTEAQVTSQLQHPNIPPVHDVGVLPDGRPYYCMRWVEGRTLASLLRETAAGERVAKLLPVFEQVCDALAYAHSKDVIHRDLKPANVMVGAFGEVQLMDWGLAKVIGSEEAAGEALRTDEEADTQAGSILGTYAYMPPEQARADSATADKRSDVFGLGAMLCEILTGSPPYAGEGAMKRARAGDVSEAQARLANSGADAELVELASRCLRADAKERPAEAGEVARGVRAYQVGVEERLRRAEVEKARAELAAAEQRKLRWLAMVAGGVLVLVLSAGIVGTTIGLRKAEKASDVARRRSQMTLDTFNDLVSGIQNKLQARPDTQDLRKELLGKAREGLQKLMEDAERFGNPDHTLVWAQLRLGDVEKLLGDYQAAKREYEAGHELAKRITASSPQDQQAQRVLSSTFQRLGDIMLLLGKDDDALILFDRCLAVSLKLAQDDPANSKLRHDLLCSYNNLGDATLQRGKTDDALGLYNKGLEVGLKLARDDPGNLVARHGLVSCYVRMGDLELQRGKIDDAYDNYERCLKLCLTMVEDDPRSIGARRDLFVSYNKLGEASLQRRRTDDAAAYFNKGLEVGLKLAGDDPRSAAAQLDLLACYMRLGMLEQSRHNYPAASGWYRKGRAVVFPLHEKKLLPGKYQDAVAFLDSEIAVFDLAEKAIARANFALEQKPDQTAALLAIRVRALLHRRHLGEAIRAAECLRDWAETRDQERDESLYNAACAFALCAADDAGARKDLLVSKTVAVLTRLRDGGYFRDPERLAHFRQDADFAGMRGHTAFAAFVETLTK